MTPEQRKELHKKNQEHMAKKRARHEAVVAARKGRKQPAEVKTAQPTETAPERAPEAPAKAPEGPEARERVSLGALKARGKETWPKAKYMADAKRDELVALLERGDAELFKQYQETWAKRSKVRYEAWLRGNSKSAEAVRAKKGARATE